MSNKVPVDSSALETEYVELLHRCREEGVDTGSAPPTDKGAGKRFHTMLVSDDEEVRKQAMQELKELRVAAKSIEPSDKRQPAKDAAEMEVRDVKKHAHHKA